MSPNGMERCLLRALSSRFGNCPSRPHGKPHPRGQRGELHQRSNRRAYGRARCGIWCDVRFDSMSRKEKGIQAGDPGLVLM